MTKIELHIAADSAEELRQAVLGLATSGEPKPNQEPEPVAPEPKPELPPEEPAEQPPVKEPAPSEPEPMAAKPKRTRTKKDNGDGAAIEPIEAPVTVATVRAAFKGYLDVFGIDAAMEDGPQILARIFGEDIDQIKNIPDDDPAKLAETVAQVKRAIDTNEFKRTPGHEAV